jgi:hypothetical protein
MDIDLVIRALRSHIDNQIMISEHYDYRDLEELHLDEEVIQAKKQADRDIQNSQELLKELTKLKSTNYDNKTPDLFSCTSLPFMEVVLSYQKYD